MTRSYNISIHALNPDYWEEVRALRLESLQATPGVFHSSYDDAIDHNETYWRETLNGQDKCVFGLFDNDMLVGITGIFRNREDLSGQSAVMGMSYIREAYRGRGFGNMLHKARIDWAVHRTDFERIEVSHRAGNKASKQAILNQGFAYLGRSMITWPDNTDDYDYLYGLELAPLREEAGIKARAAS